MQILVVRHIKPILCDEVECIGVVDCVSRKDQITGQITGIHDRFQELVPVVDV